MTQLSSIRRAQADFPDRKAAPHPDKYHPHCGEQHRHKPTKAIVGIALLIVLSVLLYGIKGHATESPASNAPPHIVSHTR